MSLAAALAIPLTTDAGAAFPNRELIIFLTFCGHPRHARPPGSDAAHGHPRAALRDDGLADKEETKARIHAAEAALARLDELVEEEWVREDTAERLRGLFDFRRERFRGRFDPDGDGDIEDRSLSYQRLLRELLEAERQAVLELQRRAGSTPTSCAASYASSISRRRGSPRITR